MIQQGKPCDCHLKQESSHCYSMHAGKLRQPEEAQQSEWHVVSQCHGVTYLLVMDIFIDCMHADFNESWICADLISFL